MTKLNLIQDKEIKKPDQDKFGHKDYANILKEIIEDSNIHPPYSIGILGKWGTGKSSIKELYTNEINDSKEKKNKYKFITFNAWNHGSEGVRKALFSKLYLELGGTKEELEKALFVSESTAKPELNHINLETFWKLFLTRIWILLMGVCLLSPVILLCLYIFFNVKFDVKLFGIIISIIASSYCSLIAKEILDLEKIPRFVNKTTTENPIDTTIEFQTLLQTKLSEYQQKNKKQKIIIFVDDLDRLEADEMKNGLDAIRLFLEPSLAKSKNNLLKTFSPNNDLDNTNNIIFVISCDENKIVESIQNRGVKSSNNSCYHTEGRRYLDRIFQFRIEIPKITRSDMREFAKMKLKQTNIEKELGKNFNKTITHLIHPNVSTPRQTLQLTNAFLQSYWIAQRRESQSKEYGKLRKGTITNHPITLAILTALKIDFPRFYEDLQEAPELIKEFKQKVRKSNTKNQNTPQTKVEKLLTKYFEGEDKLKEEYKDLELYLCNFTSAHKYPPSIKSFLELNQDPFAYKYGDEKLTSIRTALINNNHDEFLELFNKKGNSEPFKTEESNGIKLILEDLKGDGNETHLNNAYKVLLNSNNRIQDDSLKGSIISQLVTSSTLRTIQENFTSIKEVFEFGERNDKRQLLELLITELCKLDESEEIKFEMYAGEPYTIEQAEEVVKDAIDLILSNYRLIGTDPGLVKHLQEWLSQRNIKAGENSPTNLGFNILEDWFDSHTEALREILGIQYIDLIIEELSNDRQINEDKNFTEWIPNLLKKELERGSADSTRNVSNILSRLVSLKDSKAVEFATEFYKENLSNDDTPSNKNKFIQQATDRFTKDIESNKKDDETNEWTLTPWKKSYDNYITILEASILDLEDTTIEELISFAQKDLLKFSETENYAIKITNLFEINNKKSEALEIVSEWAKNPLGELREECLNKIGSKFHDLEEEIQTQFLNDCLTTVNEIKVSSENAEKYKSFIKCLEQPLQNNNFINHLKTLLNNLRSKAESEGDTLVSQFAEKILPILFFHKETLESAVKNIFQLVSLPPPTGGTRELYSHKPQLFVTIHKELKDKWNIFQRSEDLNTYFIQGEQYLNTSKHDDSFHVLQSLDRMLLNNLVSDPDAEMRLHNLACKELTHALTEEIIPTIKRTLKHASSKTIESLHKLYESGDRENTLKILKAITENKEIDSYAITSSILKHFKQEENQDPIFQEWLSYLENPINHLLEYINNYETGTTDRSRIWQQVKELKTSWESKKEIFKTLLQSLLQELEQEDSSLLTSIQDENESLINTLTKNTLTKIILDTYKEIESVEIENGLLHWLKTLDVNNSFINTENYDAYTEEKLNGLSNIYPNAKKLKEKINLLELNKAPDSN